MTDIINFITANGIEIAGALLAILGGFSVLAKFTPTKTDDKIIAAILTFIHTLGLTKK